jgi:hypothetical protein
LGLITGPGAVAASPLAALAGTSIGGALGAGIGSLACGTPAFPNQADALLRLGTPPFAKPGDTCDAKPRAIPRKSTPWDPVPPPDRNGCKEEISACIELCSEAKFDPDMKHIWGGSKMACLKGCISNRCLKGFKF